MTRPAAAGLLAAGVLALTLLAGSCDQSSDRTTASPTTPATPATPASTPSAEPSEPASYRPSPFVPTRARARLARWHLPYAVARAAVTPAAHGSVLVIGGLLPGDRTTGRGVRLDLASGHASPAPPLSTPVHDAAAGLVAGRPTVAGGGNTSEQAVVQSLDHGAWHGVGRLPTTRSDLSIVEWRHRAYAIGGYDGASQPTAILRLAAPGPPHRAGALLHGVRYAATARVGAAVFVIGGEVAGQELDTVQRVDLVTGRTRPAGRLPRPLGHAMAAAVGGRILVMGGRVTPTRQTAAMWWFDPATGRFHRAGRLPTPLSDAAVTSVGRRVWLLGGETPAITSAVTTVTLR